MKREKCKKAAEKKDAGDIYCEVYSLFADNKLPLLEAVGILETIKHRLYYGAFQELDDLKKNKKEVPK